MSIDKNHIEWQQIYESDSSQHKNKYPHTEFVSFIMNNYGGVKDRTKIKILDLGCGWGNNLSFLKNEGFDYYGIDFSKAAVDHCKKEYKNISLGDISNMPYKKNYFNCVFDRMSIQHNSKEKIKLIFSEVFRVMDSGGVFFSILASKMDYSLFTTYLSKNDLQNLLCKYTSDINILDVSIKNSNKIISQTNIVIAKKV